MNPHGPADHITPYDRIALDDRDTGIGAPGQDVGRRQPGRAGPNDHDPIAGLKSRDRARPETARHRHELFAVARADRDDPASAPVGTLHASKERSVSLSLGLARCRARRGVGFPTPRLVSRMTKQRVRGG